MRKTVAMFLILALAALAGCEPLEELRVSVTGDKVVTIKRGQELKLMFSSNPTTGYIWELAGESVNKGVIKPLGDFRYVSKSRRIGAGGTQIFRCKGLRRGEAKLAFVYRRPWKKEESPARKVLVRVMVH